MSDFNLQEHFFNKSLKRGLIYERDGSYPEKVLCTIADGVRKVLEEYSPEELEGEHETIMYYVIDKIGEAGAETSKEGVDYTECLNIIKTLYNNLRHYDSEDEKENCDYGRYVLSKLG